MTKIILGIISLSFTFVTFGQEKKQVKFKRVISEMTKANEGDTVTHRTKINLEWSDLKMTPLLDNDLKAHLELTFGVFTKKVNVWTGVITVESYGGIRRDLSWVNPNYISQEHLDYLQLKYEIAHYFAKKSEKEINTNKINAGNTKRVNGIIEKYLIDRDRVLNEIDIQSEVGNKIEIIENWKQKLNIDDI
jgi:hypothetical protein